MKTAIKITLSVILIIMLTLCIISCDKEEPQLQESPITEGGDTTDEGNTVPKTGVWTSAKYLKDTTLGEGAKTLTVTVKAEGQSVTFTVKTDKDTVGAALIDNGLIEGEDSQFGLYIKKVNGILADYDVNKSYWAFYVNGDYAMSGVDSTQITEGTAYLLEYTK